MTGPLSRVGGDVEPFRQLWATVLGLAVDDLTGVGAAAHAHTKKQCADISQGAQSWFMNERRTIGGFIWICHILDLDPDRTRKLILEKAAPRTEGQGSRAG